MKFHDKRILLDGGLAIRVVDLLVLVVPLKDLNEVGELFLDGSAKCGDAGATCRRELLVIRDHVVEHMADLVGAGELFVICTQQDEKKQEFIS